MNDMIKTETRKLCLLNGKDTLEELYSLKDFPVFIGCTEEDSSEDLKADMNFDICKETGFIQLRNLLPLDLIYSQYHSEALGKVWNDHHEAFAKFLLKFCPKKIFEIGGSNAVIAQKYLELESEAQWTILEPNPAFVGNEKIKMIKGFFDENYKSDENIDAFVHTHVIEHLYEPFKCLELISQFLETGSKHIFSIPNLNKWLSNKFPNALNFEHTFFLTEYFLDQLLPQYGFKIIEKHYFEEHSIFYATEKVVTPATAQIENKYNEYKKLYLDFIDYHLQIVKGLNEEINNFDGKVYLFGAHIFSQMLLYFGLNSKKISKILDDSKLKQGKRLYGYELFVGAADEITEEKKVMVIVKAGIYTKDISERLALINPNVLIRN